jgi:transcriptional regulator with XRE-family HTH domain
MARDICFALGERIRGFRQSRGWRQIDLAEQGVMHENYVSDLETGHKEICLRMLQTLPSTFGMKAHELLEGIDE